MKKKGDSALELLRACRGLEIIPSELVAAWKLSAGDQQPSDPTTIQPRSISSASMYVLVSLAATVSRSFTVTSAPIRPVDDVESVISAHVPWQLRTRRVKVLIRSYVAKTGSGKG